MMIVVMVVVVMIHSEFIAAKLLDAVKTWWNNNFEIANENISLQKLRIQHGYIYISVKVGPTRFLYDTAAGLKNQKQTRNFGPLTLYSVSYIYIYFFFSAKIERPPRSIDVPLQ